MQKTSFSPETFAGAIVSVAQCLAPLRYVYNAPIKHCLVLGSFTIAVQKVKRLNAARHRLGHLCHRGLHQRLIQASEPMTSN
jgi:hypothetical protein